MCVTKHKFVALVLDGAMRKSTWDRKPVKKAQTIVEADIWAFLQLIFWPKQSINFLNPSLKDLYFIL